MTKKDRHPLDIQQGIAGAYTQTDSMRKHIEKQLDCLHTSRSTILLGENQLYPIFRTKHIGASHDTFVGDFTPQ